MPPPMIVAIFVVRTTRKIPMARDRRRVLGGTLAILAGLLVLAVPFVILANRRRPLDPDSSAGHHDLPGRPGRPGTPSIPSPPVVPLCSGR